MITFFQITALYDFTVYILFISAVRERNRFHDTADGLCRDNDGFLTGGSLTPTIKQDEECLCGVCQAIM